jgi:hypothetical protein
LPEESMVPRVELPPVVLFTDQVTVVLAEPVTVAEKVSLTKARILAVEGETETETEAGDGGGVTGLVAGFVEEEQEASAKSENRRKRMENRVGAVRPG